jgi:hypothetical protein
MDGDELAGCIGGAVLFVVLAAAALVAIMAISTLGAAYGAGTAIHNYALAFRANVRPQRSGA